MVIDLLILYSLYTDRFTLWVIARPCRQFEPAVLQLGRAFLQIDTSVLSALPRLCEYVAHIFILLFAPSAVREYIMYISHSYIQI